MQTGAALRNFLLLPYSELEDLNLRAKAQRQERVPLGALQEERLRYLADEPGIKALTVLFSDLEGRLHMLDYDKKFLLRSHDNLTFDGSSIRGFTPQRESDLRLSLDWSAFYWAPADIFGPGKVLVFGDVLDRESEPFPGDVRGALKKLANDSYAKKGYALNAANEIEGFLFQRSRRGTALSRNRKVRIRQHGRVLSLVARRSVAQLYRYRRRGSASDGIPEREGPP